MPSWSDNKVGQLSLPAKDEAIILADHTVLHPNESAARSLLGYATGHMPNSVPEDMRVYYTNERRPLAVFAGLERPAQHGLLLHLSLSYAHQLPNWKMVRMVKEAFFPADVDAMMLLPRHNDYVNEMRFCLHVWQCPSGWRVM